MIYVAGGETGVLVAVVALTVWSWRTSPCYRMLRAQRRQDRRDLQAVRAAGRRATNAKGTGR